MIRDLAARRREELTALVEESGGTITPKQIVAFAANEATALHSLFLWDNDEAAQLYRESQAAKYLRAVVTMVPRPDGPPITVRAFVSLSSDRESSGAYRPIMQVLDDDEQRETLLRDALTELAALQRKYGHLEELRSAWDALSDLTAA
jgi:hypothetical protein